ncbi:MAG: DUF1287 domain-containing protein [Candidatus Schekmanbacteria bacterium]|nr:DUF1287 domain-containing protein [Candidatus Schekmanbacteria bacterium]
MLLNPLPVRLQAARKAHHEDPRPHLPPLSGGRKEEGAVASTSNKRCLQVLAAVCVALSALATDAGAATAFRLRLAAAAEAQPGHGVRYDPAYVVIDYPGGDVPADRGVCTDVVIRAYRELGIDLQVAVHEDMSGAFRAYPHLWGLAGPDRNIDHRRVPNLATFFSRHGEVVSLSAPAASWEPGDIVTWRLSSGVPHVGIVASRRSPGGDRHDVVHNVGAGPQTEDVLYSYEITGHYRYEPAAAP